MPAPGGESIGKAWVEIYANGEKFKVSVRDEMKKADPEFEKAGESGGKRHAKGFEKGSDREMNGVLSRIHRRVSKMFDDLDSTTAVAGTKLTNRIGGRLDTLRVDLLRGTFYVRKGVQDMDRSIRESDAVRFLDRAANSATRLGRAIGSPVLRRGGDGIQYVGRQSERLGRTMDRTTESIIRTGDGVSRAFGRGSRNNFLNFFGGFIGGSVKLLALAPRLISFFASGAAGAGKFVGELRNGASIGEAFAASGFKTGGMLAKLGPVLIAAGVAAAVLVTILPVLVSILSLLGGVVVALTGSITFGLVGGLAALSALVLPLAGGLGVLVGSIASMDDGTKKALRQSIDPLIKRFKDLGDLGADALFAKAPEQAERLGKAFTGLDKLVSRTGDALSDVADTFIDSLSGDSFDGFIDVMETFIPNAIRTLGHVADDVLGGIGGLFEVIAMPGGIAERFLNWIARISSEFNEWANSAKGQNSIAAFLDRAGDSAETLGDLIDNVGELLGELFTAGQESGDTMIGNLADKVQDFVDYLNDNPGAVKDFFGDVTDFGNSVGTAIEQIFHLIDVLDSPTSRKAATAVFDIMTGGIEATTIAIGALEDGIANALQFVGGAISLLGDLVNKVNGIPAIGRLVPDGLGDSLKGIGSDLKGIGDQIDGKEYKLDVDTTDLEKVGAIAKTSDESLRQLLHLPPIAPKVKADQLGDALTLEEKLIKSHETYRNVPEAHPKVDRTQVLAARLATLQAQQRYETFAGVVSKGTKIKIDKTSADIARDAVQKLIDAMNRINPFKDIYIRTHRSGDDAGNTARSARGSILDGLPERRMAFGGMLNFQQVVGGEAGREALVPLDRPLDQVDPSVRFLAAVAQGRVQPGGGTQITIAPTVVTPTKDPSAVAREVADEIITGGGLDT